MKSIDLFTAEIDDLDIAIADLEKQLAGFSLQKNSAGIVFAHPDTDFQELSTKLQQKIPVSLVGCTAMAMLTTKGFQTEGISVHIMTGDDCTFVTGVTEEVNLDNIQEKIQNLYQEKVNGEEPKVIIAYGNLPMDVPGDTLKNCMDVVSKGVPLYGGLASDNFTRDQCKVFCDDQIIHYGVAILAICGGVQPALQYQFSVANFLDYEAEITAVQGNKVQKLGDKTLMEAIKDAGMLVLDKELFCEYAGAPFRVKYQNAAGDNIEYMRHLVCVDKKEGSGIFLGSMPQGAKVKIALLSRDDIHNSVAAAVKTAINQVYRTKNYKYHTVLVTSCASRLMNYSKDITNEALEYVSVVAHGMSMSGFYSFGEFCPIEGNKSGKQYNAFHNTTFTILLM